LRLLPLPSQDNEDYEWIDPRPDPAHPLQCGNCHAEIYREWSGSPHARSATGSHFLDLYAGSDRQGRPGSRWNVLAQNPEGAAVCVLCHAPTFTDRTLEYDLRAVQGVAARGVHCDYCHKVVDVPKPPDAGAAIRFGRDGLTLLRPSAGQLFFGPLDDALREGEAFGYSALYRESRYCAPCHEGTVFGVHAYGTYSEWLASPARTEGKQCQSCHMRPTGKLTNIAPGKGGIERAPHTLASHTFPGGELDLLRRCLQVTIEPKRVETSQLVRVTVRAETVGHRVPTGFLDRNLLLVVEACDGQGQPVALTEGPRLPAAAGEGYAGLPGQLFARLLHDLNGNAPMPFWKQPHGEIADTRLFPGQAHTSDFRFSQTAKRVRVWLLYRRFWKQVADRNAWADTEIVVVDRLVSLAAR
jgi:hypothetical protein